jgi:hypothetical protein
MSPYEPWLAMPTTVAKIDPNWASCVGYVLGWKDPPSALPVTTSLAIPKLPTFTPISKEMNEPTMRLGPFPTVLRPMPGSRPLEAAPPTSTAERPARMEHGTAPNVPDVLRTNGDNRHRIPTPLDIADYNSGLHIPLDMKASHQEDSIVTKTKSGPPESHLFAAPEALVFDGSTVRLQDTPSLTRYDGSVLIIQPNGLVVERPKEGKITIPFKAFASQFSNVPATLSINAEDLGSTISKVLETSYTISNDGSMTFNFPSQSEPLRQLSSSKRGIGVRLELVGWFVILPVTVSLLVELI